MCVNKRFTMTGIGNGSKAQILTSLVLDHGRIGPEVDKGARRLDRMQVGATVEIAGFQIKRLK